MKQYTPEEIQQLLTVTGGSPEDQAAALAVVEASILESRRLGRIATRAPKSSWHKSDAMLRSNLTGNWGNISGR
jgi:hypothetical protein